MDDIEKIRQLVSLVSDNDLGELELEEPDFRVKIKNKGGAVHYLPAPSAMPPTGYPQWEHPGGGGGGGEAETESPVEKAEDEGLVEIVSPMVGTLYRSPSEGAEPYVTVGDVVEPETVVCIVEAMKVMNEVKAEVSGVIEEVLVQNAEPVEYNQVLFLVRPDEEAAEEE